jgi:hypothetical protein
MTEAPTQGPVVVETCHLNPDDKVSGVAAANAFIQNVVAVVFQNATDLISCYKHRQKCPGKSVYATGSTEYAFPVMKFPTRVTSRQTTRAMTKAWTTRIHMPAPPADGSSLPGQLESFSPQARVWHMFSTTAAIV